MNAFNLIFLQTQLRNDIPLHIGSGRSRESDGGGMIQACAEFFDAGIIGSKIMTPFTDAMGFIHSQ